MPEKICRCLTWPAITASRAPACAEDVDRLAQLAEPDPVELVDLLLQLRIASSSRMASATTRRPAGAPRPRPGKETARCRRSSPEAGRVTAARASRRLFPAPTPGGRRRVSTTPRCDERMKSTSDAHLGASARRPRVAPGPAPCSAAGSAAVAVGAAQRARSPRARTRADAGRRGSARRVRPGCRPSASTAARPWWRSWPRP